MPTAVNHPFRSSDLCWEQCARLLLTLPIEDTLVLQETVQTIVHNLQQHPDEDKYSRLKLSNAALQRRLFAKAGGLEVLVSMGFVLDCEQRGTEKVLIFPLLPRLEHARADIFRRLDLALDWLADTVAMCVRIVEQKSKQVVESQAVDDDDKHPVYSDRQAINRGRASTQHSVAVTAAQHTRPTAEAALEARRESLRFDQQEDFQSTNIVCPAEVLIQLQWSTGKRVTGGFMLGDELDQVMRFARSYYTNDR
jgi:hypothetical protein